ncbi:MAG: 2-oxoacid:acceptor oxidoreductase family protein [Moorellales bacterium]
MLEIVLYGRGGQGVQLGGRIMALALFKGGYFVQSFASFGAEKRGAPVVSQIRVDEKPIRLRSDITSPDLLGLFDCSLAAEGLSQYRLRDRGVIVANLTRAEAGLKTVSHTLITVDAVEAARRFGLGRLINSVMVGAVMGALGLIDLPLLLEAVRELIPYKQKENAAACAESFNRVRERARSHSLPDGSKRGSR